MNKIKYIGAVLIAIAGFGLQQAKGDFESDLRVGRGGISGFTGPYAHLSITLIDSTHAAVTFTSHTISGNIYLMGGATAAALNVNGTAEIVHPIPGSLTGIIATNSGANFTPGPFSPSIANTVDNFGVFDIVIGEVSQDSKRSADSITFQLENKSGTWASDADVLTPNSKGFDAAAQFFVFTSPADANKGPISGGSGFAAELPVPDGGTTMMLLGAALGALGMARRYLMR